MHNQTLKDCAKRIVMPRQQVRTGLMQALFKPTTLEQLLKDDQTGEGCQLLLFKLQCGNTARLTINIGLSYLHSWWPLFQVGFCSCKPDPILWGGRLPSLLTHSKPDFFEIEGIRRARLLAGEDPHNPGCLDTHPLVREYFGEQLRSQQA